ncbi:hypothetical protein H6F67_02940 [Microcoleus sp. FACHB-1515]|uniref:lipocalin-like domain-containing protein n=1 Tax=Cyanophyceae TaxID=3028117 RepID=UPI0016867ECD|nr:lipocalin-like domain-containing protein [Microcoleus sp. FACHB-1515]MBD2088818.1 hypothetical protein [Microcoleus sp. FACHB-1515]
MKRFALVRSILLLAVCWLLSVQPVWAASAELSWLDAPAADSSSFQKAMAPQTWQFPQDFGPHEGYQTEWWYYTGNLQTAEGRPFGFQLTFFRQAITPEAQTVSNASHWRGNQIYSAHFTLSDIAEKQFYPYERFSRGQINLAGAENDPYHVWLEDWSAIATAPNQVRLQAKSDQIAIDLTVTQTRPPVLQGDRGYSVKGAEPGNASYYYSLVQQLTAGTVTIADQTYEVTGITWKDHEYSTSALTAGTVGWDWFSMQFENGAALMLYLLRHDDGSIEPQSAGKFILSDGTTQAIAKDDWNIRVLDTWKSPSSKATYPAKWAIDLPKLDLSLTAQALMPNQELNTATATYWEGAVGFQGSWQDQPLRGQGYVELTGYADRLDSLLAERTP